jgi:hypothetical protein
MPITIPPDVTARAKRAWSQLPAEHKAALQPHIDAAHQQTVAVTQTQSAPAGPAAPHHLSLAHTALNDDPDQVTSSLEEGVVIDVGSDGVIWGTGKYQQLDPGWVEAFASYLEMLIFGKHRFMADPQVIQIPDTVSIAMAGDWGTDNWPPAIAVAKQMAALHPDITIHLGDVYYSGSSDQEANLLVKCWPPGPKGSFALNSNHEMYSGSKPYFQALGAAPFTLQKGCSFFALENSNWVIVGLDSAYFADEIELFINGSLNPAGGTTQIQFLENMAAKGKKTIILSHHNGLTEDGAGTTELWGQVMSGFPTGQAPAYWYWGHVHTATVYNTGDPARLGVACRCCGHGALPWGEAAELEGAANVAWYEKRKAGDPNLQERVYNGFAVLRLDGPNIAETFYDETGGIAWPTP